MKSKIFCTLISLLLYQAASGHESNNYTHYGFIKTDAVIQVDGKKNLVNNGDTAIFVVTITDAYGKPLQGKSFDAKVYGSETINIFKSSEQTNDKGQVILKLNNINAKGNYQLVCFTNDETINASAVLFKFEVWHKSWAVFMLIGLFGGLSLFLLGMTQMSTGMQSSAGSQMRNILNRLSNNRFVAMGVGALITSVIQSSSATNVMLVSFVNSKLMRFKQTIGIILGAAIGTTITAQIIAFKLTDYALVFVSLGLAIQYLSKNGRIAEIGRAIMGFGILFFGMHIMSESMSPLRSYQPFIDSILTLEKPIYGILAGALLTALIQSSSAFIGILIILSFQQLLSLEAAISLIIGANLGTSITALMASINTTREARQVAFAHTFIKLSGSVIFVFLIPQFTRVVSEFEPEVGLMATARQIANAHTIYNIVLCLVFLPITNKVAWLINKIYPVSELSDEGLTLKYIGKNLVKAPSLALQAGRNEVLRLMSEVEAMSDLIMNSFFERDKKALEEISRLEEKVNFLRDNILEFLVKLTRRQVNESEVKEAFMLMNATREFEQIADIISTQLKNKAAKWCDSKNGFSETGLAEIKYYHQLTAGIIRKAKKVYESYDTTKAQKLEEKYLMLRNEFINLEMQHYERLKSNIEQSVSSSRTHLEIITLLRVISSHAANTARIVLYKSAAGNSSHGINPLNS
ncbi:MAG: Na/Pi symporter [Bacteroidales bacterium]|nr:Na/Pi symporter [Bacteroidales bacterium]